MTDIIMELIVKLKNRNISAAYATNHQEAIATILELIPSSATVGIGNSQTIKALAINETLTTRGNIVYDKTAALDSQEAMKLKRQALLTDWYVTGTNAISVEGHIVNIDHSGNRVAAMLFGPINVLIVIGINKVVPSLEEAKLRARLHAAPLNAKRSGLHPPCINSVSCVDCISKDRVCRSLTIIEGQNDPTRMKVLIIDEVLGF